MLTILKEQLVQAIKDALSDLSIPVDNIPEIPLEIPNDIKHGEFSTNIAMRLSGQLKKTPMEIGELIRSSLQERIPAKKVEKIELLKPGFINFYLSNESFLSILSDIIKQDKNYGRLKIGKGQKIQIEFVSANPTGPLSVAHARQAAVGDALGNILAFLGCDVKKEYYVNDEGNQINLLGESIALRAKETLGEAVSLPEEGYQGAYVVDIAKEYIEKNKITGASQIDANDPKVAQYGVDYLMNVIREDLKDFNVGFDVWAHQSKIATSKAIEHTLNSLSDDKHLYQKDGALWFKSTEFGDDKDRVVKKSDGSFTYLAPDIVYHKDKYKRGFSKVINIWGPDHHGYIPRIKAAVQALGYDADALEVLIVQLATIYRDGKPLSMSTRKGQFISLREVIDEVGVDAARFFFLMRQIKAHLDFDLELAKKETPENPVYYIQYAHARINSLQLKAKEQKIKPKKDGFKLLKEPEEINLIKNMGMFSDFLVFCYKQSDPQALVGYLMDLAKSFHRFYDHHKVIGVDPQLESERLGLTNAAKIVFANGLRLLGVGVPEKM